MLGSIIGNVVGSPFAHANTKDYQFQLFGEKSNFTADCIMTVAVAEWLLTDVKHNPDTLSDILRRYGERYPSPLGGYGNMFNNWLTNPTMQSYGSFGNGAAMRVSAIGWMFDTLEETERVAEISASVTHNHPEGIKGAQATSAAIFLARTGKSKEEIQEYITHRFNYDLIRSYQDVCKTYGWEASCQGTVPEAIIAFLASDSFEDSIRKAISMGGDSDTLGAINGGIAEAFYKDIPEDMANFVLELLPEEFKLVLKNLRHTQYYKDTFKYVRLTPRKIEYLRSNEVFVFGSNVAGFHGGGAAKIAMEKFGAVWGQGEGFAGQSYAIPTLNEKIENIASQVDKFIAFAHSRSDLTFYVTRIGCGIAGFKDEQIAPLFKKALKMENVFLPKSFYDLLKGKKAEKPVLPSYLDENNPAPTFF